MCIKLKIYCQAISKTTCTWTINAIIEKLYCSSASTTQKFLILSTNTICLTTSTFTWININQRKVLNELLENSKCEGTQQEPENKVNIPLENLHEKRKLVLVSSNKPV